MKLFYLLSYKTASGAIEEVVARLSYIISHKIVQSLKCGSSPLHHFTVWNVESLKYFYNNSLKKFYNKNPCKFGVLSKHLFYHHPLVVPICIQVVETKYIWPNLQSSSSL